MAISTATRVMGTTANDEKTRRALVEARLANSVAIISMPHSPNAMLREVSASASCLPLRRQKETPVASKTAAMPYSGDTLICPCEYKTDQNAKTPAAPAMRYTHGDLCV